MPRKAKSAAEGVTWHADRAPQEVTQCGKAPRGGGRLKPRVCGPQGLAQDDSLGPRAVAVLVQQHHRPPEDGALQVVRCSQKHPCSTEKPFAAFNHMRFLLGSFPSPSGAARSTPGP